MMQQQDQASAVLSEIDQRGFKLIAFLMVIAKYKKQLLLLPLLGAAVAAAISFVIPNTYMASTKLLPPQQPQTGAAALLSQLGGIAGAAAGVAGLKNPNDLYIGMLKSRTVSDKLIADFGLKVSYDLDTLEKTRKKLAENTLITAGKDGLITIQVEDEDQKRVAKLANAYVTELIKLNQVIAVTEAAQRRVFFEQQLLQAKNNLANAEATFKRALDTTGVISVDADSRAMVETVGRLRARVSAKEIELGSMRAFATVKHPEFLLVQRELNSLRQELSSLENGRPGASGNVPSADKQPGLASIKVLRDVKYYQMLYELLAKQYEAARLDEARESAVIQILDPAVEPERKIKPKRAIIVLLALLLCFAATVLWAFVTEGKLQMIASPTGAALWKELTAHMKWR